MIPSMGGDALREPAEDALRRLAEQASEELLDPYCKKIVAYARARGITVEVLDDEDGYFSLSLGGRRVITRGALSELTSAVALSWCDDKRLTRRLLSAAGLRVPDGLVATFDDADLEFLAKYGEIVVKPARGEQGWGVTVGVRTAEALRSACQAARAYCPNVLLEEYVEGVDVRAVVIDHELVAAAIRHPAAILGNGVDTVADLVAARSRQREAETDGESTIPVDEHLRDTVARAGYEMGDVLEAGKELAVRRTANLHTGGTLEDVTGILHPNLARVAVEASRVLRIPVVGIDLLVPTVRGGEYVIVEANERPGLDNHQPQPTHERFLDLLFPETKGVN